ncbi:MAG: LysR family transcriptional regulator [Lachnospiraceae bacterium]
MTLQQLKYVAEIADKGSMNEAAKGLYITQPTLSGTVRELEQELGFTVFIRSNKGTMLTPDGVEFLSYARQVLEHADILEERYYSKHPQKKTLFISSQHYTFAADAFIAMVKELDASLYNFALKEKRTAEIIEDIKSFQSEIGILYVNKFNEKMMARYLKENHLKFVAIFEAKPHVFVCKKNPLAVKRSVTLEDLKDETYLYFDQRDTDPVYFSEEILSTIEHRKKIAVSDRATMFNLLTGLNGYTMTTGIVSSVLNGSEVIAIPLEVDETMTIGYVSLENSVLSPLAELYVNKVKEILNRQF